MKKISAKTIVFQRLNLFHGIQLPLQSIATLDQFLPDFGWVKVSESSQRQSEIQKWSS